MKPPVSLLKGRLLSGSLALLFAVWAVQLSANGDSWKGVVVAGVACLIFLLAAWLRFGWTLPCLALGIIGMWLLFPPMIGDGHNAAMRDLGTTIWGILIGLTAGVGLDFIAAERIAEENN